MTDSLRGMAGTRPCECGRGDVYPGLVMCHTCRDVACERLRFRSRTEETEEDRERRAAAYAATKARQKEQREGRIIAPYQRNPWNPSPRFPEPP